MRVVLLTAGFVFISSFAFAQEKLVAIFSSKGAVIEHKVAPKESLYALSRKYNVPVADIATANGFDKDKGLVIGQTVNIPLNKSNFNQKSQKGTPVYYSVGEGEGLLSVSGKFNKVPLKTLREWNGMKDDVVRKDLSLVVGYLGISGETATVKKEEKPVEKKTETATAKKEEKPAPKKEETAKVTTPVKVEKKPEQVVQEKIEEKHNLEKTTKAETPEKPDETGFFRKAFEQRNNAAQSTNRTLMSGVFKTDAGLNDRKYYMLMDGVAPGTIVKLSNPQNGNHVFAKVLGNMKDVKYSENLNVRISEVAAKTLGIADPEMFVVIANY